MSNWEEKKKVALERLYALLDCWQGRRRLKDIRHVGPDANNAVLQLELESLPLRLPYNEENMGKTSGFFSIADIMEAECRGRKPDDEESKNIIAWINLLGEAVPEQDLSGMITQEEASFEYDIPAPTLLKYARKKPGEVLFLWSIKKDGHRYYRKKDIRVLKQSRNKL